MTIRTPFGEYRISQSFGQNPSIYAQFGMAGHNGVDMVAPAGFKKNVAFFPGLVHDVLYDPKGYGYHVKIVADDGFVDTYAHFARIYVKKGDRVERWDVLGEEGSTGFSTGAHCHFGRKPVLNINTNNGYFGSTDPLPGLLANQSDHITQDDMTEEEKKKLETAYRFAVEVQKSLEPFRQVEGTGEIVYDAKLDPNYNAKQLKNKVDAGLRAVAAMMRGSGLQIISGDEAKKKKYVRVISARDVVVKLKKKGLFGKRK